MCRADGVWQDRARYNVAQVQVPVPVPGHGTPEEAVGLIDPDPSSQITAFQPAANPSPAGDFPPGTSAADPPPERR